MADTPRLGDTEGAFRCPRCGDYGITAWRVVWLGPAIPTRCRACGGRVGVGYGMLLWHAPTAALVTVALQVDNSLAAAAAALGAALWSIWVTLSRTRLIAR